MYNLVQILTIYRIFGTTWNQFEGSGDIVGSGEGVRRERGESGERIGREWGESGERVRSELRESGEIVWKEEEGEWG